MKNTTLTREQAIAAIWTASRNADRDAVLGILLELNNAIQHIASYSNDRAVKITCRGAIADAVLEAFEQIEQVFDR